MTSALVPVAEQEVLSRLQTVGAVLAPDLTAQELTLFAMVATRSGLDPFAKQIYAVKRAGRVTFQTGIDGYRSIAERTGEYDGSDEPEFGPMVEAPFPHPEWARVTVYRYRDGRRLGQSATAYWDEFYPGPGGASGQMWLKMRRNQLAKCAEALAMRKAFPYVLADIYTPEEMDQAGPGDSAPLVAAAAQPTAAERIAARRAAIEQPAEEGVFRMTPIEQAPQSSPVPRDIPDAPADGLCGAESPIDGARCGIAADASHRVHKQLVDGQAVQTWPA